jgi:Protein of unknown function, DUF481
MSLLAIVAAISLAAPGAPDRGAWKTTLSAGLVYVDGNAFGVTTNGAVAAERRSSDWILGARAQGTYGIARSAGQAQRSVSAAAASAQLRADRRHVPWLSSYVLAVVDADHVKSVEWRPGLEVGAEWVVVDRAEGDRARALRLDAGLRTSKEHRFQYYPSHRDLSDAPVSVTPRLALAWREDLSKEVAFAQDAEVLTSVNESGRTFVNASSSLLARIAGELRAGMTLKVAFDSAPAPGKREADTTLGLTFEYGL